MIPFIAINSFPVVLREMRVAARKPWIYWMRQLMATLAIGAWMFIFLAAPARASGAEKGMVLLGALSCIAMLLALLSGVFLTADCLSEEKREGTLGLLFLTTLKGHDVVLGKLVANAAVAFFALLAILPVLCLPLLTGGVTWAETLRVMLALLLSLALSLSLGMFISVRSTESRKAFVGTLLSMVLVCALPMLAMAMVEMFRRRWVPDNWFFQSSPIYTLMFSFDRNYGRFTSGLYWRSILMLVLMTVGLLSMACWLIRSSWQAREAGNSAKRPRPKHKAQAEAETPRLRTPAFFIDSTDIYRWLSFRGSALGSGTWWFLAVLLVFWFVMLLAAGTNTGRQAAFMFACFTAFGIHLIMKAVFALEATRQIHQDVRSGSMELLLATPLHERAIISGQIQAVQKRFRNPLMLLIGINLMMQMGVFLFYDHLHMRNAASVFSVFFLGGIVVLHSDYRAIQWLGVWNGLRAKTHLRATLATLTGTLGPPWIFFPILFAIAVNQRGGRTEETMFVLMLCWFGASFGFDQYLINRTKGQLRARFRDLAANRGG
jgi:ABC-type transport system involved in multi-copper enzyme maturation permease subunit